MYEITTTRNPALSLPNLDFAGAPCGIVRPPMACFAQAVLALAEGMKP